MLPVELVVQVKAAEKIFQHEVGTKVRVATADIDLGLDGDNLRSLGSLGNNMSVHSILYDQRENHQSFYQKKNYPVLELFACSTEIG